MKFRTDLCDDIAIGTANISCTLSKQFDFKGAVIVFELIGIEGKDLTKGLDKERLFGTSMDTICKQNGLSIDVNEWSIS